MQIKEVSAKKIRDSRNEWTIEVSVNGFFASSPSGISAGKYETPSYRKSLDNNIKMINKFKELKDTDVDSFSDLSKVESLIKKKFKFKSAKQFGANALFALESAILKSLAFEHNKELWEVVNPRAYHFPTPVGNAVGGGFHSKEKHHPAFQEFLIIPKESSFSANVVAMSEIHYALGMVLNSRRKDQEGAWETSFYDEQILSVIDKFKKKVHIGVDMASSTIYDKGYYHYGKLKFSRSHQIKYVNHLIEKYHLLYVEDPLQEEDFQGFKLIKKNHLVVGDDLTATNIERLKKAFKMKSINAIIIKPNQNSSLLELKEIFDFCKKRGIYTIMSHRAGETLDSALADYAFAFQADYIKCGISTKWREIKLQRLIEIERCLANRMFEKKSLLD